MRYNKLTEEERNIILEKGTEKPFSGEYNYNFREGVYICRRCNAPLYLSSDKFKSDCGWPSFDDEIGGAIRKEFDSDKKRTEILCMNCNAHLGHVFTGEKLTAKDTRHCVNSLAMKFIPADFQEGEENFVVFGGGCFWCLDAFYRSLAGVKEVISGYAGGWDENPNYKKVSDGETGHAEVVKIIFDPKILNFKKILELFFKMHDPTSLNRQGNDVGEQYRSIILFTTWNQYKVAVDYIKRQEKEKIYAKEIVTEIKPFYNFYKAEEYHQDYFNKNSENAYCQMHIAPKLVKLKEIE